MNIVNKLKIIKTVSGLTQEKLAQKLMVSFVTLNSWINGRSEPRKGAKKRINNLFFKYAGKENIIEDPLKTKKEIILKKSQKYKNILAEILKNPDIKDQFLLSLTYHTNKLEGSTLTENETRTILFDNTSLSNKTLIEQMEAKNHQTVINFLFKELSSSSFKIDKKLILKIHSILMNGIDENAGNFRKHAVRIVGSYVPTANYLKIPALIKKLVKDINYKNKDIVSHISRIHSRFEKIHPFGDGNGRVGRLIMMIMLLKNNLPPAIIKQQKRSLYNSCLKKSQLKEDFLPLEDFICNAIIAGFLILERK
jgi:Fic family protein/DNA-binding XRE family transcriptional regulator